MRKKTHKFENSICQYVLVLEEQLYMEKMECWIPEEEIGLVASLSGGE